MEAEGQLTVLKGAETRLRAALGSYIGGGDSPKGAGVRELSRDYDNARELLALLKR